MIKITGKQMLKLDVAWHEEFGKRLALLFREQLPEATAQLDDAMLQSRVVAAYEKALKYGIETQQGIARFVGLSLTAGADFDEAPAVRTCLEKPVVSPDYTINLLVEQLANMAAGSASGTEQS